MFLPGRRETGGEKLAVETSSHRVPSTESSPLKEPIMDATRTEEQPSASLRRGIPLGRLFGIEVTADLSLLVIFALLTLSLGSGTLPAWHPDWDPVLVWLVAIGAAVLF